MAICRQCGQETGSNSDLCAVCSAKKQNAGVGFSISRLLRGNSAAAPKNQTSASVNPVSPSLNSNAAGEAPSAELSSQKERPVPNSGVSSPLNTDQNQSPAVVASAIPRFASEESNHGTVVSSIPSSASSNHGTVVSSIPSPASSNHRTVVGNIPATGKMPVMGSQAGPKQGNPLSAAPVNRKAVNSKIPQNQHHISIHNNSANQAKPSSKIIQERSQAEKESAQQEVERIAFSSEVTGYGDEELEIAILAGIMKDSYVLSTLKGKGLMIGLFSTRFSRGIFQSILSLREESPEMTSLDKIVIKNKLKQLNLYDDSVQKILNKIFEEVPPDADRALHYLELMKEQALKRKLKEVSQGISDYIDQPEKYTDVNIETFTNKIVRDVRNIQKARSSKRINLVREEMHDIMQDIEKRETDGDIDIIGYSCEPMHYLCQAISGFRKGFMYAIAGAPRRGKTTFTLELATRVATLNHIPVLFFTYEQTKKNLTYRLLAKESRLNPDTLQRKRIYSDIIADAKFTGGWKKMQEYMDYFYIIEATKEDTVDRIRSYAYNVMQDFNTEDIMIFVDYIQKMPLSRNYNDEKFKVEEISTELKALSIELNNPIMTISSLSKEGCLIDATESSERPTMYHCKGSGDLEYDLDCAMIQAKDWGDTKELKEQMQQRAEMAGKDATRVPKIDVVNLYLDKNRDAPEGIFSVIQYLFFIEDNKFVELGPKYEDDRYRFGKIEELIDKLIEQNYIVFFDKPKDSGYHKGRVSIKLKDF